MAKKQKPKLERPDPAEALQKLERPTLKWKVIAQVGVAFAVLWVAAGMMWPYIGFWGVGVAGLLTLAAAGFGIYLWRLTRKQARIVDILKTATDAGGRKAALEALESAKGAGNDALNALARAQLAAQDDPAKAIEILESIDLKKAPAVVQDDVRANLALMYLMHGRVRDARPLADEIRLDRTPQAKSKALYAAVVAETHARSGKPAEARKLIETYDPDDPEYGEVAAMLLRAQCFTYAATKNRGLARKAMEKLLVRDPSMVAALVQKGGHPELQKMARGLLGSSGVLPKPKVKIMR